MEKPLITPTEPSILWKKWEIGRGACNWATTNPIGHTLNNAPYDMPSPETHIPMQRSDANLMAILT